jgi:HD-like signal output (HDOD) protein
MDSIINKSRLSFHAQQIKSLSTIPPVSIKIIELTSDPYSTVQQLSDVIMGDPPLSARLLKTVNSPFFGLRQQVTSVEKAVIFLGFNTIRELATGASVCELFKKSDESPYDRVVLWKHSILCGLIAKELSVMLGTPFQESIFTAGLLHEIGIIMMDQYLHDDLCEAISRSQDENLDFNFLCSDKLGFTPEQLASAVMENWKIPELILKCICYKDNIKALPPVFRQTAAVLFLAEHYCKSKGIYINVNSDPDAEYWEYAKSVLNISETDVAKLRHDAFLKIISYAEQFFNMLF